MAAKSSLLSMSDDEMVNLMFTDESFKNKICCYKTGSTVSIEVKKIATRISNLYIQRKKEIKLLKNNDIEKQKLEERKKRNPTFRYSLSTEQLVELMFKDPKVLNRVQCFLSPSRIIKLKPETVKYYTEAMKMYKDKKKELRSKI